MKNNGKINEIGQKLDISEKDIENIKKEHDKKELIKIFFIPIAALCSFTLGYVAGYAYDCSTYPYCIPGFAMVRKNEKIGVKLIIIAFILSIFTFILGFKSGDEYGCGFIYGVYNNNLQNPFHEISTRLCNMGINP